MKSVKPGRGASKRGAAGAIGAALFGIFWCILAAVMGFKIMIPFGLIFVGLAIYDAGYFRRNAEADPEDRDSIVDIVDDGEADPPVTRSSGADAQAGAARKAAFCPYCGCAVERDYTFCPGCGKQLPD